MAVLSGKEKVLLFEFMGWLCGREHLNLDYVKLIKEFDESRMLCNLMCPNNEKDR